MRTKGWFGPKLIGFGVGPRTWEGFAVIISFAAGSVALVGWAAPQLASTVGLSADLLRVLLMTAWTAALAAVIALTYDRT